TRRHIDRVRTRTRDATPASPPPNAALRRQLHAYLEHLAHERRASPKTVEHYGRDLEALCTFLEALASARGRDFGAGASAIDLLALRAWLGDEARRCDTAPLARRISAAKGYFRFPRTR